jgi:hypothetical protein
MAVNVSFILKHCFSPKPPPVGKGYASVQYHIKQMKMTMKDVLFELTTGYRIMNPIRGLELREKTKNLSKSLVNCPY